ncbi:nitronate monooxygenase [Paraburkholderia nemoris]|uniref:NAD(P)H-dependent flavin oxidoreductase n=1 Tax=Paraburkholderia nemoris TaxID=2793076 RepID=UPI0038BB95F2
MSVLRIPTRFTRRFGVRYPFAGAGMVFAPPTPDRAIAVSNAGGIGSLAVGCTPPEQLRTYIRAIRGATSEPFNVNFITCFDNDGAVRVCAEEGVPIVSFHWGHPRAEQIRVLRDACVSIWEQVASVEAARIAIGDGAELVITQDQEIGGHKRSSQPTFALLQSIVDAVGKDALVLASGRISDDVGIAAAFALGADAVRLGVRVGTQLVTKPSCNAIRS